MGDRNGGISVLFKGARLASWHRLSQEERSAYEQEHVDLMLGVAQEHRMWRLEGFRLMAPPYGRYGYYEYYLARSGLPEHCVDWARGVEAPTPLPGDPHEVSALDVDADSVVAVLFERGEAGQVAGEKPVTEAYVEAMGAFCKEHGLLRLECFKLMAPQAGWHQVWLAEFPAFESAEAWIQAEKGPGHGCLSERSFVLTRKWAPAYFAGWTYREES
jgi:hypothetical protein